MQMVPPLTLTIFSLYPSSSSSSSSFSLSSPFRSPLPLPKVKPATAASAQSRWFNQNQNQQLLILRRRRRRRRGICRAELSQDAPFAIAIGACMLNSLLFPQISDEEEEAIIGPTDARFAVMSIISFIPYFNWLSWVFALMDTGNRRYAVYAAVYLAPYLRTNLSLSPEESWLPIASIVLCIVHIQLEASIKNGDRDAFAFFNEAAKRFGLGAGSKDDHSRRQGNMNKGRLPSGQARSKDEIGNWRVPRKPSQNLGHENEDSDLDDGTEH